ncbi:hypothetical protein KCU74_g83, partial [Aureobasidium melanogenum]
MEQSAFPRGNGFGRGRAWGVGLILLHELRYYSVQSFLTIDSIAMLHVGRIEESVQQVTKAKWLEVRIGTSSSWRATKHVVENARKVIDGLGVGLGTVGVARSKTGRVLEVGTAAGEDAYVGFAVRRLWCGIASSGMWLTSGSTDDLVQHPEDGVGCLSILRTGNAALGIGAVLEGGNVALVGIWGIKGSVCPWIGHVVPRSEVRVSKRRLVEGVE